MEQSVVAISFVCRDAHRAAFVIEVVMMRSKYQLAAWRLVGGAGQAAIRADASSPCPALLRVFSPRPTVK